MAHGKELRMRNQRIAPLVLPLARGRVAVVDGYGIKISTRRGHLVVEDGLGRDRRTRVYARVAHGLSRVVVLGHDGFITLAATRWLNDLGISLLQVDRDGSVLTTSAGGTGDARLHRLQALAPSSGIGVAIAKTLLGEKLAGQRRVLKSVNPSAAGIAALESCIKVIEAAETLGEIVLAERDAAITYWAAWSSVAVHFTAKDTRLTPAHWLRFGQRGSPLSTAPRLAVNPANALLNYLYALLEAETRIACLAVGLDPGLGVVHVDYRSRDSFVLDVMEAARPDVDAFVLTLLRTRKFTRSDFAETRRGICRILPPLSHELSQTAEHWGRLIAPIVEAVAHQLADSPGSRIADSPTPLTRTRRQRTSRQPKRHVVRMSSASTSSNPPACKRCGGPVPRASRVYCDDCLPPYQRDQYAEAFHGSGLQAIEERKQKGNDPTHGDTAGQRRATSNVRRKSEVREWDERFGKLTDLSAFQREILPLIQTVPLSRLQQATSLSLRYVSLIRRGEKTPHPRHWQAFFEAGAAGADSRRVGQTAETDLGHDKAADTPARPTAV